MKAEPHFIFEPLLPMPKRRRKPLYYLVPLEVVTMNIVIKIPQIYFISLNYPNFYKYMSELNIVIARSFIMDLFEVYLHQLKEK